MTPKEIFLELLKKDGKPERLLDQYEALQLAFGDPVNNYLRAGRERGSKSVDRWGVTMLFPEDAPGAIPYHSPEATVLQDITRWKEVVHAPDLVANCSEGWEEFRLKQREKVGEKRILAGFMGTGIFEQLHFLMGFEDTMLNLYEHPKEMHELIDYILQYRLQFVRLLLKGLQPDAIFSHDDWGTKTQLFMKPDIWREFFKEPYRKFYGEIRQAGAIAIHHADSYLVPILDDMAEIGIQCWQGILPENNIPEVIRHLDGRMVVMGGVGAEIDRADSTEEEIRRYMRKMLRQNATLGHFIPSITYGVRGTIFKHVDPIIDDEIARYNSRVHLPHYNFPVTKKRYSLSADGNASGDLEALDSFDAFGADAEAGMSEFAGMAGSASGFGKANGTATDRSNASAGAMANADGTSGKGTGTPSSISPVRQIASQLMKGNRSRIEKACHEALEQGYEPQEILNDGLIAGMTAVGNAFSAGRLFVPEMLMSAKCMTTALDILKPKLVASAGSAPGKACIGTVKGDLHDIGKNLVKIMLEGNGFDVIDLGSDVSAETFVETAQKEHCDIICCSALLTTTMEEMRRVVDRCREVGIRDDVIIMIGGAPVTQEFCDNIGADIYTPDATAAAKAAVAAMQGRQKVS